MNKWIVLGLGIICVFFGGWYWYQRSTALGMDFSLGQDGETFIGGERTPATEMILVEISGEVQHPGVYELVQESRVEELIELSGGVTAEADLESLTISRAAKLRDEQKIIIPAKTSKEEEELSAHAPSLPTCTDINVASSAELQKLSGVGEARSSKIIANRPYQKVDDLTGILPKNVLEENRAELCVR